nr:C-type lectin domain family 7 member A isoform X3 [Microcebus murinus]
MEYHSDVENVDEDGYTQLHFNSPGISRIPMVSEKGVPEIPSSSCPPNWIRHEKSCYLFRTSLDTWNRSKRQCSQLSSNLLKIDSSKELEFIIRQVSSQPDYSFWIGLSRPQPEGQWLWEDGSTFSSNLFQLRSTATQENSSPGCVWIHVSIIYDQLCSVPSYSICEKKLSV